VALRFGNREKKSGGGFKYKRLTSDYMNQRRNQSGSDRDPYVSPHVKLFSPADGDNTVRILPAGWEGDETYGKEIYVHYGIGADRATYLCPRSMKDKPCPICKEKEKAEKEGDEEYSQSLRVSKRIGMFVIDRSKEGDGPKLWLAPFTVEREMAAQSVDKKTGEVIQFIDPEEGFDLNFEKKGKQRNTKYVGVQFDRKPSALSDDDDTVKEWLQYIADNPIPDLLVFQNTDTIRKNFEGASDSASEDEDESKGNGKLKLGKKKFGLKIRS
jgi:hypothetical protein